MFVLICILTTVIIKRCIVYLMEKYCDCLILDVQVIIRLVSFIKSAEKKKVARVNWDHLKCRSVTIIHKDTMSAYFL